MRHNSDLPGQRRTGVMGRIIKTLFQFYPVLMPTVVVCIIFNAVVSSIPLSSCSRSSPLWSRAGSPATGTR